MHIQWYFSGIGYFKGIFSSQLKASSKPYQTPSRHVAYALQEPFKKKLGHLQEQKIIMALGVYGTAE